MSRLRGVTLALTTLLASASTVTFARDGYAYGPPPDWAQYKAMGEAAVRALLPVTERWQIDWPNGYKQGAWPMKGKPHGYVTCGFVRTVRADGSILDSHPFAVIIDQGAVKGVDYKPSPGNSIANLLCAGLNRSSAFPPASSMAAPASGAGDTATPTTLGIAIRPIPEGAYVTSVTAGSPAAIAGLKPGMVVASVNAVPLAGMGDAMVKVIDAAGLGATLTLVDGKTVKLNR